MDERLDCLEDRFRGVFYYISIRGELFHPPANIYRIYNITNYIIFIKYSKCLKIHWFLDYHSPAPNIKNQQ